MMRLLISALLLGKADGRLPWSARGLSFGTVELFGAEDVSPPNSLEAHRKGRQLRVVMVSCLISALLLGEADGRLPWSARVFVVRVAPGESGWPLALVSSRVF